ncbi:MAG: DUF350 domain-containing protein [Acidobacteria bacterium]|nr:DUF350 domain-containing protein [Acidobacteriota bacterium]
MSTYDLLGHLKTAVVFALLGLVLFGAMFLIIVKVSPFSIRKELEEDQNIALGILLGSMILGMAIILAAAIHG